MPREANLKEVQEQVKAPRLKGEEGLLARETRSTSSGTKSHELAFFFFFFFSRSFKS